MRWEGTRSQSPAYTHGTPDPGEPPQTGCCRLEPLGKERGTLGGGLQETNSSDGSGRPFLALGHVSKADHPAPEGAPGGPWVTVLRGAFVMGGRRRGPSPQETQTFKEAHSPGEPVDLERGGSGPPQGAASPGSPRPELQASVSREERGHPVSAPGSDLFSLQLREEHRLGRTHIPFVAPGDPGPSLLQQPSVPASACPLP